MHFNILSSCHTLSYQAFITLLKAHISYLTSITLENKSSILGSCNKAWLSSDDIAERKEISFHSMTFRWLHLELTSNNTQNYISKYSKSKWRVQSKPTKGTMKKNHTKVRQKLGYNCQQYCSTPMAHTGNIVRKLPIPNFFSGER